MQINNKENRTKIFKNYNISYKKSILFICSYLKPGGLERQLVELANELTKRNFKCTILLLNNTIHYNVSKEVIVYSLNSQKSIKKIFESIMYIRNNDLDIIHSWGPVPSSLGILLSIIFRKPHIASYIRSCRIPKKLSKNWIRFRICYLFSYFITSNTIEGLRIYGILNSSKGVYIPNGFNFKRIENIRKVNDSLVKNINNKYKVCMVASFYKTKDWDTFIKVSDKINSIRNDVNFIGIGEGPDYTYFLKKIQNKSNIIFPGSQNNIEAIIDSCDVCVLLSIKEGMSNVLMEYMALAKSVITTSGGGTPELIKDGINGYSCNFGDVCCIYDKILFLLDNLKIAEKMGNEGKRLLKENFSINQMVNKYILLYNNVQIN